MNLAAFGYAVVVVAYGALAMWAFRSASGAQRNVAQRLFLAALLATAAWGLTGLAAHATGRPALAVVASLLDLARYGVWVVFAALLLRRPGAQARGRFRVLVATVLLGAVATALLVAAPTLWPTSEPGLTRSLPLLSLAWPVGGLVLVEQLLRRADPDARWHIKPLCIGMACIFLYDVYLHSHVLLFGRLDADSVAIRGIVHALPVALLYVAAQRRSDWSASFGLSRDTVFHTATLMLAGAYLLALSAIGYYVRDLGGDLGRALELVLLCMGLIALAVLVFSGALRAKLRVFVGKNFFSYRYDYRTEWLRFTARLTSADSPHEVGPWVARAMAEMLHSPAAALWYRSTDKANFVQTARWNAARDAHVEPVASAFADFIRDKEWVVDLNHCRRDLATRSQAQVPAWLLETEAYWLVIPLIAVDDLEGFVVVQRPHASVQVDWEVRDLLKTAGRQAASYLALMHATDALLEARKFEAFNKMSAFVVHDLKNIVAQLSLMMQNAQRLKGNAEFQDDMLTTVQNSLEKMRRLMLQLRSGETPAGAAAAVSLPAVIDRLCAAARTRGWVLKVHAAEAAEAVVVRGHEDRVERVLGHLIDNAIDATDPAGSIGIAVSRQGAQARIVVRDSGHGMSPEFVNNQLFRPFATTKGGGMGVGAYESRQYVHEIGGSLSVESELGRGTVVTILLPLFDPVPEAAGELHVAD